MAAKKTAAKKTPAKKTATKTPKPAAAKRPTKPSVKTEEDDAPKVYFAPPGPKLGDAPKFPVVNAKCRRGQDKQSMGQSCNSIRAENMTPTGSNIVQFRCVACKYSWQVPMGGSFQGL